MGRDLSALRPSFKLCVYGSHSLSFTPGRRIEAVFGTATGSDTEALEGTTELSRIVLIVEWSGRKTGQAIPDGVVVHVVFPRSFTFGSAFGQRSQMTRGVGITSRPLTELTDQQITI